MQRSLEILAKKFAGTEQTFDGFFISCQRKRDTIEFLFSLQLSAQIQHSLN